MHCTRHQHVSMLFRIRSTDRSFIKHPQIVIERAFASLADMLPSSTYFFVLMCSPRSKASLMAIPEAPESQSTFDVSLEMRKIGGKEGKGPGRGREK